MEQGSVALYNGSAACVLSVLSEDQVEVIAEGKVTVVCDDELDDTGKMVKSIGISHQYTDVTQFGSPSKTYLVGEPTFVVDF